jgi:hypothetical protein
MARVGIVRASGPLWAPEPKPKIAPHNLATFHSRGPGPVETLRV